MHFQDVSQQSRFSCHYNMLYCSSNHYYVCLVNNVPYVKLISCSYEFMRRNLIFYRTEIHRLTGKVRPLSGSHKTLCLSNCHFQTLEMFKVCIAMVSFVALKCKRKSVLLQSRLVDESRKSTRFVNLNILSIRTSKIIFVICCALF